jgi:hypothetical protein
MQRNDRATPLPTPFKASIPFATTIALKSSWSVFWGTSPAASTFAN